MRFGRTLRISIYEPWGASNYIDYAKLKHLLREDEPSEAGQPWTEEDESKFVEELLNVQLEKVNSFHQHTYQSLLQRTSECEARLEGTKNDKPNTDESGMVHDNEKAKDVLLGTMEVLDGITNEINELEKYSRTNYTGFLKSAKKHDRKRGSIYRVRPLLQVRLTAMAFNSEDYSPLLYRLSAMYSFTRKGLNGETATTKTSTQDKTGGDAYKSHKFLIHPENLLEVKTYILRRLPVLVYNPQSSKVIDNGISDPTITSLYLDNPQFSLYNDKLSKVPDASSLRLRWYGQLADNSEILFEKKTTMESGDSEEVRFTIKEKYIKPFLDGSYKMEKSIDKLRDREHIDNMRRIVEDMQTNIKEKELQPVLRANYTRTAFQIPGDDKIRISIDTNVAFIREDALEVDRPCRSSDDWHRSDIDKPEVKYPFTGVRNGEISRFPYALLEIKLKDGASKRTNNWVGDLISSHLVKESPDFSKFVHGVSVLFEDYVNSFPFWLSDLESDIRKDPGQAFQEEQEKKAKKAENERITGSFLGLTSSPSFKAAVGSPVSKNTFDFGDRKRLDKDVTKDTSEEADSDDQGAEPAQSTGLISNFLSFPPFSNSKYARAHRNGTVQLPPGIRDPGKLIKDMNPVQVEPKVWLANQRTYVKWQHISVLLASLSLGLYNAAGKYNDIARGLAVVYTLVAIFAGAWGWWMFLVRSRMIQERSGKDFDNVVGPVVVCLGLVIALCLNFGFKYQAAVSQAQPSPIPSDWLSGAHQDKQIIFTA